jgi:hypothetical protein
MTIPVKISQSNMPATLGITAQTENAAQGRGALRSAGAGSLFTRTLDGVELPRGAPSPAQDASKSKAMGQLEELVIRQTLERVLPKGSGAYYGKGLAGDIWRGMLADGLAKSLAERELFGLRTLLTPPSLRSSAIMDQQRT